MRSPFVMPASGKNVFRRLDTCSVLPPANESSPSPPSRSIARSCFSTCAKVAEGLRGVIRDLAGAPALHADMLDRHVARRLVVPHTEKDRLTQFPVGRPLGELHLDDDLRRDPVRGLVRSRRVREWRRAPLELLESRAHGAQSLAIDAPSHVSHVLKP